MFVQLTMEKGEIRLLGPNTVTTIHNTEEAVLTIKNSGSTVEVCTTIIVDGTLYKVHVK